MFKQLIAFALLLAFMVQTMSKTFIVFDYYANTAAYAKNCENKAKPTMHCNGKCQMMKKLKAEEKQQQQNAERKAAQYKAEVLSTKSFFPELQFFTENMLTAFAEDKAASPIDRSITYFRPPSI